MDKKKDDEIIELTEEELDEIFADEDFESDDGCEEVHSFVFSNPDPYAKVEPRPDDAPKREFTYGVHRCDSEFQDLHQFHLG